MRLHVCVCVCGFAWFVIILVLNFNRCNMNLIVISFLSVFSFFTLFSLTHSLRIRCCCSAFFTHTLKCTQNESAIHATRSARMGEKENEPAEAASQSANESNEQTGKRANDYRCRCCWTENVFFSVNWQNKHTWEPFRTQVTFEATTANPSTYLRRGLNERKERKRAIFFWSGVWNRATVWEKQCETKFCWIFFLK